MSEGDDDQQSTHQAADHVGNVEEVEFLQAFQDSAEDSQGKANRNRSSDDQEKPAGSGEEFRGYPEQRIYGSTAGEGNHQGNHADQRVAPKAGVDQQIQPVRLSGG